MLQNIRSILKIKTKSCMLIALMVIAGLSANETMAQYAPCDSCQTSSRTLSHFDSLAAGPSLFGYPNPCAGQANCSQQPGFARNNFGHSNFALPETHQNAFAGPVTYQFENEAVWSSPEINSYQQHAAGRDIMDTRNFSLLDYRRMFVNGTTPTPAELAGRWRGVNKGIVELVGYRQFIKEITPQNCQLTGDNVMVEQVSADILRSCGWQVKADAEAYDGIKRKGKFSIEEPRGIGAFKHGTIFNYRNGDNKKSDPVRLLVDKVVKIDDNHLLGRATANFGPLQIPLAYFVLERMDY